MNAFYGFLLIIIGAFLFLFGVEMGEELGKGIGARLQKDGQITWHTNTTTNVFFTANK